MHVARGAVLGALLALPASLSAQIAGTATVVGEVTDSVSGHGVDGAVVLVSGTLLRVRTDAGGRFRLAGLPPGHYSITVLGIGYERDSVPMLDLGAGETRSLEIPLHPAPVGLADVVVTAAMAPEQSAASAASIAVLTEAEVRRRNVVTIDQALVYVPGITLNGPDQLDIRGAAGFARGVGSRVLLMLDGHPILSGDGAEIDFESLPLLDLAHVEVVKGAYSAQYGSNALGGVVNLITEPVRGAARTVLQVHAGVYQPRQPYRVGNQTRNFQGLGIQHEQRIGELGTRLFVGRETSDGFEQNGATSRWLVRGKLTSPPAAEHPWDLYALWVRERAGEFFIWQADSLPYRVDTTTGSVGDHTWATKLLTGGSWTALSRPGALLRLSPYLNYNSLQNEFRTR